MRQDEDGHLVFDRRIVIDIGDKECAFAGQRRPGVAAA